MSARLSQTEKMRRLFLERTGQWIPCYELAAISLQYNARIFELRAEQFANGEVMITVLVTLTQKPGQTLYCNCELESCDHYAGVCTHPATVLAEIYGIKVQLCRQCLAHHREAVSV